MEAAQQAKKVCCWWSLLNRDMPSFTRKMQVAGDGQLHRHNCSSGALYNTLQAQPLQAVPCVRGPGRRTKPSGICMRSVTPAHQETAPAPQQSRSRTLAHSGCPQGQAESQGRRAQGGHRRGAQEGGAGGGGGAAEGGGGRDRAGGGGGCSHRSQVWGRWRRRHRTIVLHPPCCQHISSSRPPLSCLIPYVAAYATVVVSPGTGTCVPCPIVTVFQQLHCNTSVLG